MYDHVQRNVYTSEWVENQIKSGHYFSICSGHHEVLSGNIIFTRTFFLIKCCNFFPLVIDGSLLSLMIGTCEISSEKSYEYVFGRAV